jgi:hypothetical protein
MLIGFAGLGFMTYRRTKRLLTLLAGTDQLPRGGCTASDWNSSNPGPPMMLDNRRELACAGSARSVDSEGAILHRRSKETGSKSQMPGTYPSPPEPLGGPCVQGLGCGR